MKAVKINQTADNVVTLKAKTLEKLTKQLHDARMQVEQANQNKLKIELQIYEIIKDDLKDTGTTNFDCGLKVVSSLDYKVDQAQIWDILDNVELPIDVFKYKVEVSGTKLKELQDSYPDMFTLIAPAITVKPNKPYMTVR